LCSDPGGEISTQGTVQFFADLGFKQDEDEQEGAGDTVKLLSLAYELQSPTLGKWTKKEWIDGWKNIGSGFPQFATRHFNLLTQKILNHSCDTIDGMKSALTRLEAKIGSDPSYFRTVYNYTFTFARSEGQRSLGGFMYIFPEPTLIFVRLCLAKDTALEYWKSLLQFGVGREALKHAPADDDDDEDVSMDGVQGWTKEHTNMWLDYMKIRDDIAVSRDTWQMVRVEYPSPSPLSDPRTIAPRFHSFL
jgi:DCN1-like protein 1/2